MGSTREAKVDVPHPAAGEVNETLPVARKRELVDNAGHAVVVILDFAFEAFAGFEHQGLERPHHWRAMIAHIGRRSVLHAWLLHGPRVDGLLQPIETQFLTDVELNQHQYGATEGRRGEG